MTAYNVVYSPHSNGVYTDYDQSLIGDALEIIEAESEKDAAMIDAQNIFDDCDFPTEMIFFVRRSDSHLWLKVFIDVVAVPSFEHLTSSVMDWTRLEASNA